jgi:hypothetical protein
MMDFQTAYITVQPNLPKVNKFLSKTKKVAVTQVNPIFGESCDAERELQALRLHIEGPVQQLQQLSQLLNSAGLQA